MAAAIRPSNATMTTVLPSAANASAAGCTAATSIPRGLQEGRPSHDDARALHGGHHAVAVGRLEIGRLGSSQLAACPPPRERSPRRSDAPSRARRPRPAAARRPRRRRDRQVDVGDARLALGQRAGLVEHDRATRPEPFEGLGVANRTPASAPLPVPTMIDVGVARPSAHGQAMISTADRVEHGQVERRMRAERVPDDEREDGQAEHRRHEVAGHDIGQALDRSPRALGFRHEPDDPGEHRVRADPRRPERQGPRGIEGRADHQVVEPLRDRHALAGDHALVDRRGSVNDDAVHGDRFARANADEIADDDRLDRHVDLGGAPHDPRGPRRKPDQAADGLRGVGLRSRLEEAPEQDERHDRGGRVEVERQLAAIRADPRRPEEARHDHRRDGVAIRRRRPDRNQRVHVGASPAQPMPGAGQKRPSGPELDRRREGQLKKRLGEE